MRTVRFVLGAVAAIALAVAPALVAAADDTDAPKNDVKVAGPASTQAVAPGQFATLKGVRAAQMSSTELEAVKGLHVHFLTLSNGKLHFAGNPFGHNWSNLGGTDGQPVAPSYHGLCVAHGNGSIFIPTGRGTPPPPVTLECPPGS